MKQQNIHLKKFMEAHFDAAKFWLMLSTISAFLVLIIDIFVVFTNFYSARLAVVAVILAVLSSIFQWRSARIRDIAELVLRKFETHKGFGWEITPKEISDLMAMASKRVRKAAYTTPSEDTYFASKQTQPTLKALENLQESAWFTKHQADRMTTYVGLFSFIVFAIAFITLLLSLQSALAQNTANNIAKVTIAIIVFMFSGGYVRLAFDYNLLALEAGRIEDQASELYNRGNVSVVEVIKLVHSYQIARATAPLLPGWLWKLMQPELTKLWEQRTS